MDYMDFYDGQWDWKKTDTTKTNAVEDFGYLEEDDALE